MIVCNCFNINDKKIADCLEKAGNKKLNAGHIHRACSGADKPQCGQCIPALKEKATIHNKIVDEVNRLKEGLPSNPAGRNEPVL